MLVSIDALQVSIDGASILHGVRLSLKEGDIYGLLGPNGAGKSTTINTALGLIRATGGHIEIFGNDVSANGAPAGVRGKIGVLPEQGGFYDWMTATDYLGFFAALYGLAPSREDIHQRLLRVGLDTQDNQIIGTFSRGMKQRLGLARALIPDPLLLILDEPTNGLDPRGRREVHEILSDLAHEGVGVLLCTHLLDDVERLCTKIGIIDDGRTVAEGTVDDLLRGSSQRDRFSLRLASTPPDLPPSISDQDFSVISHDNKWWHIGINAGIRPETVWPELFAQGWDITEIHRESRGLENLYLALTEGGIS